MRADGRERWRLLLGRSIRTPREIARIFGLEEQTLTEVTSSFPALINPYFLSLIRDPRDPMGRQVIPDPLELEDQEGSLDPLAEEKLSPVPNLIHRYPDRVVLLASNLCAVNCRFCNRRRRSGKPLKPGSRELRRALAYLRDHSEVRDVLISGGDPLMLEDWELGALLRELREIPHVEILRIGTRVPSALPQRVTRSLCRTLKKYHPIFMSLHFNHPTELTRRSVRACSMLADSGIPLGSQTVLLKGVNDDAKVLDELIRALVSARVKPYYLFHLDHIKGASHFRIPVAKAVELIQELSATIPLAWVPQLALDLPGGGGKAVLGPGCASGDDLVY